MKFVPNAVSTKVARSILVTQKNSPTLLFGAGIVGVVASTVLACRSTLKVELVLDEAQNDLAKVEEVSRMNLNNYSEQDAMKDKAIVYVRTGLKLVKLYAPSIILGSLSIAALTGSHRILNSRNAALSGAYAALEKAFGEYRERVVAEVGPEKEKEIRYAAEERTIVEEGKNGPKKKQVKHVGESGASLYARFFQEGNQNWHPVPEANIMFLRCQQNWANDRLQSRGHIFLNEVYDALGIERTQAGQFVGWVAGNGDNYIDFGIWDDNRMQQFHDFAVGRENAILLDFNVDGEIHRMI